MQSRASNSRPLLLAAFVLIFAVAAQAQNGRANTNSAQAVLHIQVVVIPTVLTPAEHQRAPEAADVSYSVPTINLKQEITTRESVLRGFPDEHCLAEPCVGTLRTKTIVAR